MKYALIMVFYWRTQKYNWNNFPEYVVVFITPWPQEYG